MIILNLNRRYYVNTDNGTVVNRHRIDLTQTCIEMRIERVITYTCLTIGEVRNTIQRINEVYRPCMFCAYEWQEQR